MTRNAIQFEKPIETPAPMLRSNFGRSRHILSPLLLSRNLSNGGDRELHAREYFRDFGGGEVSLEQHDSGLAIVRLSNVSNRNALSGKMMAELADVQDTLDQWDDGVCVILTGDAGTFCAGADLSVARVSINSNESGKSMCDLMTSTLMRWRQMPLISVAAVEGAAVGGGAELATACDHRIMHRNATIRFVHTRMGVTPGWGGGGRLTRLVGRQAALRLLAGAVPVNAQQAATLGLVDDVAGCSSSATPDTAGGCNNVISIQEGKDTPDPGGVVGGYSETLRAAVSFVEPYLSDCKSAVRGAKTLIHSADDLSLHDALREEKRIFGELWGGEDNVRALRSSSKGRGRSSSSSNSSSSNGSSSSSNISRSNSSSSRSS